MLQKRKEWKEEQSNTHSKLIIDKEIESNENKDKGGMVRDPLLDSKHQPLLNSVDEEVTEEEGMKDEEAEEMVE